MGLSLDLIGLKLSLIFCQEISILSVCFDFPTDVVKKIVITRNKIFQFRIPTSTKAVNQRDLKKMAKLDTTLTCEEQQVS